MTKFLYAIILSFSTVICLSGQILFSEDFESGQLPAGWNVISQASDGGWTVAGNAQLSSGYFPVPSNGSSFMIGTNDDQCNCNKSNEYLVSPPIDLTQVNAAILKFDAYYGDNEFSGTQEEASVEISVDNMNWDRVFAVPGAGNWTQHRVDISALAGNETAYFRIRYNDNGGWMFGFIVDNILVEVPPQNEAALQNISMPRFGEQGDSFAVEGELKNNGSESITTFDIQYSVNGNTPVVQSFQQTIAPFTATAFSFDQFWTGDTPGVYNIEIELLSINDSSDEDPSDNFASYTTDIYGPISVPDNISLMLERSSQSIILNEATQFLDKPTDLDFFPLLGKDELWIVNERTESEGGSTLTISDASLGTPSDYNLRVDGNAWHFMSLPTGIAFSPDNYNFATSPGVLDANHNGGSFTGPTLWSSDPDIYAQPSGGNGSHLDMLHGSPYSMGIAHEVDNVFWVYDNFYKNIVRYDFVEDHGPGNDYHGDAIVRRFQNIGIQADGDIPCHLILDKDTGWLYFVDNGNDRVMRLDINSGSITIPQQLINEPLEEHSAIQGFTVETIIDEGLIQPSGIELFNNYLLVGDYASGDINVYDLANNFDLMGTLPTDAPGLTGIKVGPDGNIWYTNRLRNTVGYLMAGEPSSVDDQLSQTINIYPNPSDGIVYINSVNSTKQQKVQVRIFDQLGKLVWTEPDFQTGQALNLTSLNSGIYSLSLRMDNYSINRKIVIQE